MTTYELPPAPDGDVWTTDPNGTVREWARNPHGWWDTSTERDDYDWPSLYGYALSREAKIHTEDPKDADRRLLQAFPGPWTASNNLVSDNEDILFRLSGARTTTEQDDDMTALVARLVNQYAAEVGAWTS